MELKIRNGDYVALENGGMENGGGQCGVDSAGTVPLDGPPGRVPLYPYAGEYAASAGSVNARECSSAAEAAVREALHEEEDLDVTGVTLDNAEQGLYTLRVALQYKGDPIEVALTIQ